MIRLAGFAALFLFYGAYFWKIAVQRRQGISANRMFRGEKPPAARRKELLLAAVTFLLGAGQFFSLLSVSEPLFLFRTAAGRAFGLAVALCGTGVFFAALCGIKQSWRVGVDETQKTELITTGLYAHSRNPAFVGFDLFYLGFALAFPSPPLLLLSAIGVLCLHMQILEEEKFLRRRFGMAYADYCSATRRYF